MNFILSLVALVLAVQFVSACFITNCPPGGKRSVQDKPAELSKKVSHFSLALSVLSTLRKPADSL